MYQYTESLFISLQQMLFHVVLEALGVYYHKVGYLDFSHLTELEKKYISLKFIWKKQYKSSTVKTHKKIVFP